MIVGLTDLRINNVPASGTVRITDPFPTISWTYLPVTRVTTSSPPASIIASNTVAQQSFEIRISDSATNLGSNSFTGNHTSASFYSPAYSWRFRGPDLARGSTYYGQVRLTDILGNTSFWYTFQFKFNSLPTVSNVVITPTLPSVHDQLMLSYTYADSDSDFESGSLIWWYRNGIRERQFDSLTTIESKYLNYNDTWSAQIIVSDGFEHSAVATSSNVIISTTTPIVAGLSIEPPAPTTNDPLYAIYNLSSETGNDESVVEWFVNGVMKATGLFARLALSVGDVVHFEVQPNDGISSGSFIASAPVTIIAPAYRVLNLRVQNELEPLSVNSLTPSLTWEVAGPDIPATQVSIRIGTAPLSSNLFDTIIASSLPSFTLPSGLLKNGTDYFVSIAVGDSNLGDYSTLHFRTSGSRWHDDVSNTVGWTIETVFRVEGGLSGIEYGDFAQYHGIRVHDGTKSAELRFFIDKVEFVSGTSKQAIADFTTNSIITITGVGSNIKLFQNYTLILDCTALFAAATTDKTIEFGSFNGSMEGWYQNFYYSTDGAFEPNNSAYSELSFEEFYKSDGQIDYLTAANGVLYFADSDEYGSSAVFEVLDNQSPIRTTAVSRSFLTIYRILNTGRQTYICHSQGATAIQNYPIPLFDADIEFVNGDDPSGTGWRLVGNSNAGTHGANGLTIDTTSKDGVYYYSHDLHGVPWFNRVDNTRGWTVDFSLTVNSITDENSAQNTDRPDGVGVYVNDGAFYENLYFFTNQIVFGTTGQTVDFDTTQKHHYLILGQSNGLQLFADKQLIAESRVSMMATSEGNAGRPCIIEDSNGNLHCVWHDDGKGYRQLYYSTGIPKTDIQSTTNWSIPIPIAQVPYGSGKPNIAIDSTGTLYVAFEIEKSDYTDVGIVVKNQFGWVLPYILSSGVFGSYRPQIAVDSSDVAHVVWEDWRTGIPQIYYMNRNVTTGKWSSPSAITTNTYGCIRPSLDIYGTNLYVSYTSNKANGYSEIDLIACLSGVWTAPVVVYTSGKDSDYSDVVVNGTSVFVAFHDTNTGNYEIYARRYSLLLVAQDSVQQITSDSQASRFPSIGLCDGNGNVYLVWEDGGDLSSSASLGSFTATLPNIRSAYFDIGLTQWKSSNLNGGHNVVFAPPDNRTSRRPRLPKRFETTAHIAYESDPSNFDFEYLPTTNDFIVVRSIAYDLSNPTTFSLTSYNDLKVSARLFRKEIRFGDFSQTLGGSYTFGHFRYYTGDAVGPYSAVLASSQTTSIVANDCFDAVVNPTGDAWLANNEGLLFFFRGTNEIARLPSSNSFSGKSINCVVADQNHVLFAGTDLSLYVSYDHITFTAVTLPIVVDRYRSLAVDSLNRLWAATDTGVYLLRTDKFTTGSSAITAISDIIQYSTLAATKIVIDITNTVWASTLSGLVSISRNATSVFNTGNSALSSNAVNDVAIRNSAIRYVATSTGLLRMTSTFESIVINHPLWNDNVASVAWEDPNLLWAASGGNIFAIAVDDEVGTYNAIVFSPYDFALISPSSCDNPRIYRFSNFDATKLMEVYVNGRKIHHGFIFSEQESAVVFDAPLQPTDMVEVSIRNDIAPFATLAQNKAEILAYGNLQRKITKFATDGIKVYAAVTGDKEQLVELNTADNFSRPYDKIGLDTTPPTGTLSFVQQLTRRTVELAITASDNLSGIDSMIVSDYDNLTSDGTTPQDYIPFSQDYIQDLGFDLGNASDQQTFTETDGNRLVIFNNITYAGTSSPARIYQQSGSTWASVATLDSAFTDASVEFMVVYKNTMVIGTGSLTGVGKIYISSDGVAFNLLSVITGTHARCATELNSILYIGTSGSGYLYAYNGNTLQTLRTANADNAPLVQMGTNIYSIWAANGAIYAGSGIPSNGNTANQARLFRFDPITLASEIIYVAPGSNAQAETAISAISSLMVTNTVTTASSSTTTNDFYLFAGTAVFGRIVKSINSNAFITSFAGLPAKVTAAHIFNGDLWVAVGKTLYKWDTTWIARFSHTEQIEDFVVGVDILVTATNPTAPTPEPRNDITVISATRITKLNGQISSKNIFLSLKDVAGNVSAPIELSLNIDNLDNFINTNRLLELDEYGSTIFTYDGDAPFYSGNKVIQEQGVYYSDIFNGTNDHVAWDIIYWDADLPDGTDINISVRTSNFRDTVELQDFTKTFTKDQFAGGDISNLSGQFIQFKAVLSTTVRNITPKLFKVVIRSSTRASVHFFTTNFTLPSRLRGGILTAQVFMPLSADVIFGVNTNDSVDFSDYQIIDPDRVFTTDPTQNGFGLRVGVKLISPLPESTIIDFIHTTDAYDPYHETLYTNVIDFSYTNTGVTNTFDFKIELYNDHAFTDLQTTLFTATNTDAWNADGTVFPSTGLTLTNGETSNIICAVKGMASIRCGVDYYAKIYSTTDGLSFNLLSSNRAFLANCNPNFINNIFFDFTNTGSTANFNFRVRVFSDPARTIMVKNFYSGSDQTGWLSNGAVFSSAGVHVSASTTVMMDFVPDLLSLDPRLPYYLIIDYISTGDFVNISNSYTLKFAQHTDFVCAEYTDVPVVRDIGIMFDLEEYTDMFGKTRRTVLLNL